MEVTVFNVRDVDVAISSIVKMEKYVEFITMGAIVNTLLVRTHRALLHFTSNCIKKLLFSFKNQTTLCVASLSIILTKQTSNFKLQTYMKNFLSSDTISQIFDFV
jgi:hypothetical protein